MARSNDNLYAVLKDTADAIRTKTGSSDPIVPRDFADAVLGIPATVTNNLASLIDKTVTEYIDTDNLSYIGNFLFYGCSLMSIASFPSCLSIGESAFYSCQNLETINFPLCETISKSAFYYCNNKLQEVSFPACIEIKYGGFMNCHKLKSAYFPSCTSVGSYAFNRCYSLRDVSLPECLEVGSNAFAQCSSLATIDLPKCAVIKDSAFNPCSKLQVASFPKCTEIGSSAFMNCSLFSSLYLLGSTVVNLKSISALRYTRFSTDLPVAQQDGIIYVPSSLYNDYIVAANWSNYASRFSSV